MKFVLVEDTTLEEVVLDESGDRGLGDVTQVLCDLLDVVGCKGISINDAPKYILHHKNATHKSHRIYNLLLVPKAANAHSGAHRTAYNQTNPNTKKNQNKNISSLPVSYSKTVNNQLKGIGAIDVYASLYSGTLVYY